MRPIGHGAQGGVVYALIDGFGGEYIGSSSQIRTRYKWHFNALARNGHPCTTLQTAYNESGDVRLKVLEIVDCNLFDAEQKWIDLRCPIHNVAKNSRGGRR